MSENPLALVKSYLSNESVKKRFEAMLGKNAASFVNSIINTCNGSKSLTQCTPASICSAGLKAATVTLPIEPALGFAAIVPYKNVAQFQIMWKGLIQLCIRTNQYERINVTEIYEDEIEAYNPITGDVIFKDPKDFKLRYETDDSGVVNPKHVVGAYAYFRLKSGFECSLYMNKKQLVAHGKRFSKAYQYDISQKKKASLWSTDPVSMFKKTVAKQLLGKFGIMSIEMQQAFTNESDDFNDAAQLAADTTKDEAGSEVIDTDFEDEKPEPESDKNKKGKRGRKAKTKPEPEPETEKPKSQFKYTCKDCGLQFDEPKTGGRGDFTFSICPELKCCSKNIVENE